MSMSLGHVGAVCLAIDIIPEKGGQCSFYLQTSIKSRLNVVLSKDKVFFDTTQYMEKDDYEKYVSISVL